MADIIGRVTRPDPEIYAHLAEAGWRWVLDQVRRDDGPWIPVSVPAAGDGVPEDRDSMHSGVAGLAHVLAEIRLARSWTDEETTLAEGIATRVRAGLAARTDYSYFDGLVSDLGVLSALDAPGADVVVGRLSELATPTGWPQEMVGPPRCSADTRINDATLGTASVLLGALWARRHGAAAATRLAEHAADVLMAEAEPVATGTNWRFVPLRFYEDAPANEPTEMPNWSHGLAGVAAALAVAGAELNRPDLVAAALSGAEHLVSLGRTSGGGFVVPHFISPIEGFDEVTFTWCHGPVGTSLLFRALEHAGVEDLFGETPADWHRRCLRSVRTSGLPDRIRPGFWDNDGRCCGTAGAGDAFLDAWQRDGEDDDLSFALRLADALVERSITDGTHAWWRFVEHRNEEPLLPPGVGWMQGGAGIAAYLFRTARLLRDGHTAPSVTRLDTWWALPVGPATSPPA